MTGMELTEVDELVQSALCELTNISCCNAGGVATGKAIHRLCLEERQRASNGAPSSDLTGCFFSEKGFHFGGSTGRGPASEGGMTRQISR